MQRRDFFGFCGAALAAGIGGGAARANEDLANMGLLARHLLIGTETPWPGSYLQGFYFLRNPTGFNNSLMFTALPPLGVALQKVSIDVHPVGSQAYTGAGLVLNYETAGGAFAAVLLQPNRQLGIYFYDPQDGLGRLTEIPAVELRDDVVTRLSAENSDAGIDILTNGVKAGHFSDVKLKGAAGVMATDIGDYYFANFVMDGKGLMPAPG
jgi:hypothetical protein